MFYRILTHLVKMWTSRSRPELIDVGRNDIISTARTRRFVDVYSHSLDPQLHNTWWTVQVLMKTMSRIRTIP